MRDPHATDDVFEADSWPADRAEPQARRRWLVLLGVAAGALVLGSAVSTSALLLSGWRYAPDREFTVVVYLEPDAATSQREVVQEALTDVPARNGVRLQTREETYERFRQRVSNDPEQLAGVDPASMPESLHLTTEGRNFDCDPITAVRKLSGVDRVSVVMRPKAGRWGAEVGC